MGSFCTGKPATQDTSQTQSYTANPAIQASGSQALGMAQSAASQPFQMPAQPIAGFTPFQTQAFNQYQGLQGGLQPYFNNASADMQQGQTPITQSDISSYMNPYADQALANMKKYVFDPQRTQTMGSAVQTAGGQSADRLALTSQNLDKTQGDAVSQAQAGFYGQAMSAAQEAKSRALQSAQGWANLGLGYQGGQLQGTGALAGAGAQQQALNQAQLNSPYQQQLAQIAYPFQTAQFLAGITGGLAPSFGGTTTGQSNTTSTPAQPSPFNQIVGGLGSATGLIGAFGGLGGAGGGNGTAGIGGSAPGSVAGGYNANLNAPSYPNPYGGSWYADGGAVEPGSAGMGFDDGGDVSPFDVVPKIDMKPGAFPAPMQFQNISNSTPAQSSGSGGGGGVADIAKMAMMFMERGGSVQKMAGGGGPYSYYGADPYENLGNPYAPSDAAPGVPRTFGDVVGMGLKSVGDRVDNWFPPSADTGSKQSALGRTLGLPDVGSMIRPPSSPAEVVPQPQAPQPFANTQMPQGSGWPSPGMLPPAAPQASLPAPQMAPSAPAMGGPSGGGSGLPQARGNSDLNIDQWKMPQDQAPYPDATKRDWGQEATRSPWMSLVHAGAKMMQSTKNGVGGLGEGIEAGAATLSDQRKELRSEQQINQKAEELYRHAKSELLKYTRKTPHELATEDISRQRLAQERYTWQPGQGNDPTTGNPVSGAYRLPTRQGEAPQFFPNAQIMGRNGAQTTALMRNVQGLVDAGIAPDKQAAFGLLHQSVNSPAVYRRLVQAQEKILQNDPEWIGKNSEERRAAAEKIVKAGQGAVIQAGQPQAPAQVGASAESALPDPGDGNRVSGMWYINPKTGKPDQWK